MTQKELIDKVHKELSEKAPLGEITRHLCTAIAADGKISLRGILAALEPATIAYVHTYPDDISDGPWDI